MDRDRQTALASSAEQNRGGLGSCFLGHLVLSQRHVLRLRRCLLLGHPVDLAKVPRGVSVHLRQRPRPPARDPRAGGGGNRAARQALGGLLLRKRYSRYDQLAAVLLCAGLVGFTLADAAGKSGRASSPLGVGVLLFAVSCDAVQVLLSERMLKGWAHLTPMHVMLYTNGFAFLAVLGGIWITGELEVVPPSLPWLDLIVYGATSFFGVTCFMGLTRLWGATAAVVATNARKILTVVLSFIIFPKPLGVSHVLSGFAIIGGVALHSYSRRAGKESQLKEAKAT